MLNVLASTAFYSLVVMCHPSFAEVGGVEGIKQGNNYCLIVMPVDHKFSDRASCEAKLKVFTKPEENGTLEDTAMNEGSFTGVCHEGPDDLAITAPVEGEGVRRQLVQLYGPKGDSI